MTSDYDYTSSSSDCGDYTSSSSTYDGYAYEYDHVPLPHRSYETDTPKQSTSQSSDTSCVPSAPVRELTDAEIIYATSVAHEYSEYMRRRSAEQHKTQDKSLGSRVFSNILIRRTTVKNLWAYFTKLFRK